MSNETKAPNSYPNWTQISWENAKKEQVTGYVKDVVMRLVSISDKALTRESTGALFRLGTAKFNDDRGVERQPSIIMNEGNFAKGVELGVHYRTRIINIPKEFSQTGKMVTLFVMSHFARGEQSDESWFDMSDIITAESVDLEKATNKK